MMWATLLSGLFLLSAIPSGLPRSISDTKDRLKRSIDLNDVYYSKMRQYRLPSEVTPTSYHVDIKIPFIESNQFNGRVKINLTWSDTSDRITLNVHQNIEISLTKVRLIKLPADEKIGDDSYFNVARTERLTRKSWYIIHLEQMLKNGSVCEVDITYFGNFTTNETTGFYKNAYMDTEGRTHPFIATYLQLDNAQKMFPCMDESPYKATFRLSLLYPKGFTACTNTPAISRRESSDKIEEEFAETPRMSTNQFALVVSDLQSIEPTKEINEINGKRLQVKVWGRKEFMESLLHVPNKVVRIVNYLQDYFNSSFGLPKLDVMAIPMYSTSKASDNWGLVFFKESELSSPLVWTTTYELLYQWFGQSITPYRRNDAPVNKALNSFLASMATIDLSPDETEGKWPMTMLYPLYYEFAQTAPFSRVAGIRQEATWTKAELVFRMFNYTLGRDLFQRSMRNFFHQQSKEDRRTFFANDVFTYLNDVANETDNLPPGLTINGIAASWINRDRVPLVTVIRDYETGKINLTQKVYLRDIPPQSTAKVSYQWDIPLVIQAQDKLNFQNTKPTVWLKKESVPKNFTITDVTDKDNFIIVNPEEIGMFPVNYDWCNWKMLSQYLQGPDREKIPPLTRAKLLHDAWNLAYAGELCFGVALNMTLFLKEEKSHVVWEPVFTMIDHIGRRIEGLDVYLKFEAYIRSLLKPLYLQLGETAQPDEPSWKIHMRGLIQNFLCHSGYEPCVKEARDQFKKWLTDEEPDKGNPVANKFLCPVFKWGTDEEWEFGLQRVINFPKTSLARKQNERTYLLKTLAGCPKDANKIERLLQVAVLDKNENFTDADIHLIFSMMTGSATGYKTLFNFLLEHWYTVKEQFGNKTFLWDGIVNFATSSWNTQEGYDMVSKFYTDHQDEFETADAIIKKALRIINQETKWNNDNVPVIDRWLMKNLSKEDLETIAASMSAPILSTTSVPTTIKDTEIRFHG
ncbi:aminopeptidase N [Solenopsis invicta]|uniref:aminopeptidase N n=1 Tax=Solenopsis invicta TaxID=13686 RepID=UPI00193CDDDC|nr:aminopeptidase N [Solenopsis invicta]XP_025986902.2 aminopeptidase N [Solenopsis invicta]XP_039301877.1 aminopeptidase N [Solenopsis invicta]